ncbi:MAG TPA: HDOD domain-containing protein [Syntrophomonadaceae bacterium]|nr:HDOD domain-containing protein [Syntrophomonadaceae bacterium]
MGKISLEQVVAAVDDIPALPHVVIQVMELTEDPNSTAQDINDVLGQDQAMTARVLKLANSAFYGFPRRIATVTDAIVLLGFKTIKSIVMAASVSDILVKEMKGYALEPGELWEHSQSVAMAARHIARKTKYFKLDLAYTAGLLHDIGKVVLNNAMKESYQKVINTVIENNVPFLEAELEILGFSHAEVGAKVAEKWNLPSDLVDAIHYHHNPQDAKENKKLTSLIHIADTICVSMGIGIGIDGMLYPISGEALTMFDLKEMDIEIIISELIDIFSDQQSFNY